MGIADALQEVARTFSRKPFDFFNENDIQARTYEELRSRLKSETTNGELEIEWNSTWAENPIRSRHDRDYVEETYHSSIRDELEKIQQSNKESPMSRVHTEVHISQAFEGDLNEIVDVAVLNHPLNRPPRLNNGKIRIEDEAIDTLIELKRPQEPIVPLTIPRGNVSDATDSELRDAVNLDRLDIKDDINELEDLAGVNTYQDSFLLICSPFDCLRRGEITTETSHERRGKAAVAAIRDQCDETAVLYAYPGGTEWITRPD